MIPFIRCFKLFCLFNLNYACGKESVSWAKNEAGNGLACEDYQEGRIYGDGGTFPYYILESGGGRL